MKVRRFFGRVLVARQKKQTRSKEAVKVADDGPERGPEHGLVVHAAGDQVGQFGPLRGRQLVVVGVEQAFLRIQEGHTGSVFNVSNIVMILKLLLAHCGEGRTM